MGTTTESQVERNALTPKHGDILGLMREGGKLFHLKDWASKLPGAAARIGAIMHCVCIDPGDSCEIQVELMEAALSLATALIDQALAVFDLMQRDPAVEDAQRIMRWVTRQEKSQFTVIPACSVHIGWDVTARANGGFSVISTAVKVRAASVRRDRRQTGGVLRWRS